MIRRTAARPVDGLIALGFAAVFVCGLAARVIDLGLIPGLSGDEAFYGLQAWRASHGIDIDRSTPTGLPLNPLFWTWEIPLLAVFRPSVWIARAPALVAGVAAVAACWWGLRKTLGSATAVRSAALLAALPTAIGYSRFGWDQSQAPMLAVVAVAFALRADLARLAAVVGLALVVHLANVFVVAVALPPLLVAIVSNERWTARRRWITFLCVVLASMLIVAGVSRLNPQARRFGQSDRLAMESMVRYGIDMIRFVDGQTLYEWWAGPIDPEVSHRRVVVVGATMFALAAAGTFALIYRKSWERLAIVAGVAGGFAGLYVAAGPDVLGPLTTRYGLILLAPGAIAVAVLSTAIDGGSRAGHVATIAICLILIMDFHANLIERVHETGGDGQPAFRAGPVEPKAAALALVRDDLARRGERSGLIVAEDWWTLMPLKYLASGSEGLKISPWIGSGTVPSTFADRQMEDGAYAVGFRDGPLERALLARYDRSQVWRRATRDFGGRELVVIIRVERRGTP
jgi:4-amino-4-deoxy-L-arabinose transferase-like glycosyltransferase